MYNYTFFRNILVGSLCFFFITPLFVNAQATNQTQQQMTQVAERYVNYISELMLIMPDNPALLLQLQKLLLSLSDLNTSISTANTTGITVPTTTPSTVVTSTGHLFPSQSFGVDSTIISIDIFPTYNGDSRIVSKSDNNEEVVSYLSYNTDDHNYGTYDAGFRYYKDGNLLESDSIHNQTYAALVSSVNYDIRSMSASVKLVEFIIKNEWRTRYSGSPPPRGLDCYSNSDKAKFDAALDTILGNDLYQGRNHVEPISSITEYYSPLVKSYKISAFVPTNCTQKADNHFDDR